MSIGKLVNFSSASGPAQGWLARSRPGRPGVIVLQEWWGLVSHVKDLAARFAAQGGYVALAPDLYQGKSSVHAAEARHLMEGLDWGRALDEIAGAARYLRDSEGVDRVGVVGFCMGGALTVLSATLRSVDAFVAFYGFPPPGAADLSTIAAPGLIFFGEHEPFFPVPDAQSFCNRQRSGGRQCDVIIYAGAGHAFFNDDRPEVFNQVAANDAWCRTLAHFGKHLRPAVGT